MSLILLFDADDVLVEATLPAIERYNKEYKENLKLEDIKDFDMVECAKPGTSIDKYYEEPGFFRTFLPRPGMQECIARLEQEGHRLFIATSSPQIALDDKIACYEEHFPEFTWEKRNIIPITPKYLLVGDVMIDDKMENILLSKCQHKLLVDAPWNQDFTNDDVVYMRVYGARDIYAAIQKIAGVTDYQELNVTAATQ